MILNKNKSIIGLITLVISLSFISCSEDVEIWDSNTLSYSGTYDIQLLSEDETTVYVDYDAGDQIQVYNTAANVANDIWIHDLDGVFPLTSKFNFAGNSTSFMSTSTAWDDLTNNLDALDVPDTDSTINDEDIADLVESVDGVPNDPNNPNHIEGVIIDDDNNLIITEADVVLTVDREYIRSAITEGSIGIADAQTTGGNTSDSIRIKIVLYSGTVTFTSYETDEDSWVIPGTPEYDWEFTSVAYDSALIPDETYVVSGYRYTGHAEDEH